MSAPVCSTPARDLRVGSWAAPPTLRELAPRLRKTGHGDIWGNAVTGYCDHSLIWIFKQPLKEQYMIPLITLSCANQEHYGWPSRLPKFLQAYLCIKMHGRNVYGCSRNDRLNRGGAVSAGRVIASLHGSLVCQFKEWRVASQVGSCLSDNPGCCVSRSLLGAISQRGKGGKQ